MEGGLDFRQGDLDFQQVGLDFRQDGLDFIQGGKMLVRICDIKWSIQNSRSIDKKIREL